MRNRHSEAGDERMLVDEALCYEISNSPSKRRQQKCMRAEQVNIVMEAKHCSSILDNNKWRALVFKEEAKWSEVTGLEPDTEEERIQKVTKVTPMTAENII
ncbi:hypothetical protein NDU88_003454 [Pleurodeles waltl]|uniref:Uncharacterized protein n=1 Tax=Pleurodeles waltl TaxID=8319 RepID=A0AAV7TNR8_PLEWA|nr:hypothetical protein NDU88_003454 [Pleurodeles waltl]